MQSQSRALMETLEQRELLSASLQASARHAHHVHHLLHLQHLQHMKGAEWSIVPTVATDKQDYQPGETAVITGSGFQPREQVRLQVLHTDGTPNTAPEHQPWS